MRTGLLATASVAALALGAFALARPRPPARRQPLRSPPLRPPLGPGTPRSAPGEAEDASRQLLMYFIVPLWIGAGAADWACHRATGIAETTGTPETLLHLLMLAEMGLPTLAALFLEATPPVLAFMAAAFAVHEATALWDVRYATTRRDVTPIEQHVHSFLEMLPLMSLGFMTALHWPAAKALVGVGGRDVDWSLRLKQRPLPPGYLAAVLSAITAFNLLPFLEELARDLLKGGPRAPDGTPLAKSLTEGRLMPAVDQMGVPQ